MLDILPYDASMKSAWDGVIDASDHPHFMMKRDYMEYHSDRFDDASFVFTKEGAIIGVVPGNLSETTWFTHQGLSFGGIFLTSKMYRTPYVKEALALLLARLRAEGVRSLVYKALPAIYHQRASEADRYVLVQEGVSERSAELSTVVSLADTVKFSQLRRRGAKKAVKEGLQAGPSEDLEGFWQVLSRRLGEKYARKPVHTVEEIKLLRSRFPENIRLFAACDAAREIAAGVLMFETPQVAHAQYISSSDKGMQSGALDLLFDHLITHYRKQGIALFDFGVSTEDKGRVLNESLLAFKEGFAGRPVIFETFTLAL